MTESQHQLTTETALRLLAEQQRRQILRRIASGSGETTVAQLKQQIETTESRTTSTEGSDATDTRFLQLHHVHLPKLQQAGVITYDEEAGIVERGESFAEVLALLDVIDSHRTDASTHSH